MHLQARSTELERRFKALERTRDALQEELNQDLPMSLQTLQEELKVNPRTVHLNCGKIS